MSNDSSDSTLGVNNSPSHFMVLDAITRSIKDIDKISKATRLPRQEVELIINDLSSQRLIIKEEKKKWFFGGKKQEIRITDIGIRLLNSK
jgi:hypothetical protein